MKRRINISSYLKYILLTLTIVAASTYGVYGQNIEIKNGVNIQASYYNRGRVNMGWELMKSYPEIQALRIEIEPNRSSQAINWINEAQDNGYQVIATYHRVDQLGSDEVEDLLDAARWWKQHYENFIQEGPIIINIMNEWSSHEISEKAYADAYNEAIAIIREVYDGPLIVDVPGFGQATRIAADAYHLFEDKNIIFSVHIYSDGYNQAADRWLNEEDLSYMAGIGAGCMVGEFCDASRGGTDWCTLIDYCFENKWPIFGWAWNGDGNSMNMIEPHWDDEPLATSFSPTEHMDKIVDKLAGAPCYSQPDDDCNPSLIGTPCDDENEYTIDDTYNEYCHCIGKFTPILAGHTNDSNLLIYPNPVGDLELNIELFKITESGTISVYNAQGYLVQSMAVPPNIKLATMQVSHLPNGMYWLNFRGDQTNASAKFFKL